MAENELNPWQVMGRRPAPLAKLVESENERLLAARKSASGTPLTEGEPAPIPEKSEAVDELG